jgi:predicted dinucleotide-binding enzyme
MQLSSHQSIAAATRRSLQWLCAGLAVAVLAACTTAASVPSPTLKSMKIGIIGTGRIGSALARHWAEAGHEVFISSRHPEELQALAAQLGPKAHAGTPKEAAAFGEVILISVPYGALPQIAKDYAADLKGKVIIDTGNPMERRDGPMGAEAAAKGAGLASAEILHSTRVVRAFNCIGANILANSGNRKPERIAVPIGGDDPQALAVAQRLVSDAGFDPVVLGSLASTKQIDMGGPLTQGKCGVWSAAEFRAALGDAKK